MDILASNKRDQRQPLSRHKDWDGAAQRRQGDGGEQRHEIPVTYSLLFVMPPPFVLPPLFVVPLLFAVTPLFVVPPLFGAALSAANREMNQDQGNVKPSSTSVADLKRTVKRDMHEIEDRFGIRCRARTLQKRAGLSYFDNLA